ncbi:unnamed protein product [Lymnaea stagnalis]|uniref:Uncharacterized protein n=1 Tax=Lymnaea stagnalis TaxID=6523 RepID=A0AAV2HL25_LYMST
MTTSKRLRSTIVRYGLLIIMGQVIVPDVRGAAPYCDMCDDEEGPSKRGLHRCGLTEFDVEDSVLLERKMFLPSSLDGVLTYGVKNALSFLTKTSRGIPTKDAGLFDTSPYREYFNEQ